MVEIFSIGTYILATFALDMLLTHGYLSAYKKRFPNNDWTLSEANPIIRMCVRKMGLGQGVVVASGIILIILVGIIYFVGLHAQYFLAGVYSMALAFHYINFGALRRMVGSNRKLYK